jgi:hypothetical protein
MLEKLIVTDKIEILEDGTVQLREATKIIEDGKVISKSYTNRRVIEPGQDVSKEEKSIKDIVALVQTKEKVDAFKAKKDKEKNELLKNG